MKIELKLGESLAVTFADAAGQLNIEFTGKAATVTTMLPDSSGRDGVVYEELDPLGLGDLAKHSYPPATVSYRLSTEQAEARNESLVRNLRFKWPATLETYPDDVIVTSYDTWYEQAESVGDGYEWAFMGFLPGFEEGMNYPQWQAHMERQRQNREAAKEQPPL